MAQEVETMDECVYQWMSINGWMDKQNEECLGILFSVKKETFWHMLPHG